MQSVKKQQTKAQKFRQLLPEIEQLLDEYLQDAVVDILREKHDLDISLNTFKNYLHRYRSTKDNAKVDEKEQQPIPNQNHEISLTSDEADDEISPDVLKKLKDKLSDDKTSFEKTSRQPNSIFNKG